jgi:erythromycin esterase
MNYRIIVFAFFLFGCGRACCQDFYNLDFEYATNNAQPLKWSIEGYGGTYHVVVDSTNAYAGQRSLYVDVDGTELYIYQILPSIVVAGKDVHLQMDFSASDDDSLKVNLVFFNPASQPVLSEAITFSKNKWITAAHAGSFPADYSSDRLLAGIQVRGKGKFRIDNVRIRIDGKDFGNGAPDFREPLKEEVKALNDLAVPLDSIDLKFSKSNVQRFKESIGSARVIGLGENSHGSSTVFRAKLSLIKHMVTEMHFTIFILEAPVYELDKVNDYVLFGKGTLKEAVRNLVYRPWQVSEFEDIIEWIRMHNQRTKSKVKIFGMDMQNSDDEFLYLLDFAKVHDTILFNNLNAVKASITPSEGKEITWQKAYDTTDSLYRQFSALSVTKYNVTADELFKIKRYFLIFLQSMSMNFQAPVLKSRDEYMADNVALIHDHHGAGARIIVSADNDHVTKSNGRMGYALMSHYGKNYLNIGFTYSKGTYAADGPKGFYPVHEPHLGTYEYFLEQCRYKNFFLDLRKANGIELLNRRFGFRLIGSRPQEVMQFAEMDIQKVFDLLIYLKKSVHTTQVR